MAIPLMGSAMGKVGVKPKGKVTGTVPSLAKTPVIAKRGTKKPVTVKTRRSSFSSRMP